MSIKKKFLGLVFLLGTQSVVAEDHQHPSENSDVNPGDRMGLHGMTVSGSGPYLMSHIPMLMAPHDMQIVYVAELTDASGLPFTPDLTEGSWSVRPTGAFSLGDFSLGNLTQFTGTLYRGNFEHGGPVVERGVQVSVQSFLINHTLPKSFDQDFSHALVRVGDLLWLLNRITDQVAIQHHLQVSLLQPESLEEIPEGFHPVAIETEALLTEGSELKTSLLSESGEAVTVGLRIDSSIWCLQGPDFFNPCQ